jgi:hypothetical protein
MERGDLGTGGKFCKVNLKMLTHPRFQRFVFCFLIKKQKACHIGQEPDIRQTLDARIALLQLFIALKCNFQHQWKLFATCFENKQLTLLRGYKIFRSCVPLNHLLFADDLVIFTSATSSEATIIKTCMDMYSS